MTFIKTLQTPATAENKKCLQIWSEKMQNSARVYSGAKRNFWLAKFLTSCHVPMHRGVFYISKTLRQLVI